METLLNGTLNKQNIILTSSQGFERSKFLLRNGLILLSKAREGFNRIIHVCDKEQTLSRLHNETRYMPYSDFKVDVINCLTECRKDSDESKNPELILCTLNHIINSDNQSATIDITNSVLVLDGLTLENIEGTCCDFQDKTYPHDDPSLKIYLPKLEFSRLSSNCWSIILACSPPVEGIQFELGCKFPIILTESQILKSDYRIFSSIIPHGRNNISFTFNTSIKNPKIHDEVGDIMEKCVKQVESGAIVVFFPSYGRMVEYHNAWSKSGLWTRLGVPFGRENRAGDHFKNGLIELARNEKSIFLFSIRYHQDEILAEYVLSRAKAVLVVGLPYPFISDTWNARIAYNDESYLKADLLDDRLTGTKLYKYRAMEFMNGVLKRCLNEYRHMDCSFFLLDSGLEFERDKIAIELGDVHVETVESCFSRLQSMIR